jgi:uncharacterized protein (DUF1810 family)
MKASTRQGQVFGRVADRPGGRPALKPSGHERANDVRVTSDDPFQLNRFVQAQEGVFETALAELEAGEKRSHWMWFIFPQLAGLGQSAMSRHFAIRSLDEAKAYLNHPLLGPRLRQAVEVLRSWAGRRDAESILGAVDATKLRSSLTLFSTAAPDDPLFKRTLDAFPDSPDAITLQLIETSSSKA